MNNSSYRVSISASRVAGVYLAQAYDMTGRLVACSSGDVGALGGWLSALAGRPLSLAPLAVQLQTLGVVRVEVREGVVCH